MSVFDVAVAAGLDAARGVVEGALATAGKDLQRVTGERDAAVSEAAAVRGELVGVRADLDAARSTISTGEAARAALVAQVDAVQAEAVRVAALLDSTAEQLEVVTADRDLISSALASSEDDLKAAQSDLAVALARIAELEAGAPDPDPEPAARPLLGANPMTGGATSAAIARVTDRWGAGIAVRLFDGDDLSPAPAQGDAGRVLISWKPAASTPITDAAQVAAAIAPLPAGSKVCVWHEPDVKVRKTLKASGATAAKAEGDRYKARAREFYTIVKRLRPDLDVMAVLSGWTFDPSTAFDPLDYIELGAFDVLGLDLDGLDGPKDYRPVVDEAQAWMVEKGVTRWTVAEYGAKTSATWTSTHRAAWLTEQTTALLDDVWPPEEICLFELDDNGGEGSKYILVGAEKAEWDRLIG